MKMKRKMHLELVKPRSFTVITAIAVLTNHRRALMPCDTIQTTNVSFTLENTNLDLLEKALVGLGFNVTKQSNGRLVFYGRERNENGSFKDGKFQVNYSAYRTEFDINQVKRAYSQQVVQNTAQRYGWKLKSTAENKYAVQKGY
jgi:hypothetical protein